MFKMFFEINKAIFTHRKTIVKMGFAEFKREYAGSAFGRVWSVFKPLVTVAVYGFVFGIISRGAIPVLPGVKSQAAWLVPGLFAWMFLSEGVIEGMMGIRGNSHLVKKVVFPVAILPNIKIFYKLINHVIFMTIALIFLMLLGQPIVWTSFQIFYYMFAAIILLIAITRLLSAMAVISVDIVHFVGTIMQLLMWLSPVVWGFTPGMQEWMILVAKLNPFTYVIDGYRNSLFTNHMFFDDPVYTLYFWVVTLIIMLLGSAYYNKTYKEFSDVL